MNFDETAVFKLSYGLYFLSSEYKNDANICVVNTVSQQTQNPLTVSVTVLKDNYTHDLILKSKKFTASVMSSDVDLDLVNHFGTQSKKQKDKLAGMEYQTDSLNNPFITTGCNSVLSCKVTSSVDLGTHTIFIGSLEDTKILSDKNSITYSDYRLLKQGKKIGTSEISVEKSWQCSVCHYIYDGVIPFEELPEDYVCPVCKKPKSVFVQI